MPAHIVDESPDATLAKLRQIKTNSADVERRRAKALADADLAKTRLEEARTAIKEEFGAESVEAAKELLETTESELAKELDAALELTREASSSG